MSPLFWPCLVQPCFVDFHVCSAYDKWPCIGNFCTRMDSGFFVSLSWWTTYYLIHPLDRHNHLLFLKSSSILSCAMYLFYPVDFVPSQFCTTPGNKYLSSAAMTCVYVTVTRPTRPRSQKGRPQAQPYRPHTIRPYSELNSSPGHSFLG